MDRYVEWLRGVLRLAGELYFQRVEAALWKFAEPFYAWLYDLFERPYTGWQESLDAFLAEQAAEGRTISPEIRQSIVDHIEAHLASRYAQVTSDAPGLPGTRKPAEVTGPEIAEATSNASEGVAPVAAEVVESSSPNPFLQQPAPLGQPLIPPLLHSRPANPPISAARQVQPSQPLPVWQNILAAPNSNKVRAANYSAQMMIRANKAYLKQDLVNKLYAMVTRNPPVPIPGQAVPSNAELIEASNILAHA